MTEKMKAISLNEHGAPKNMRYEDVPRPVPKDGEVLIRVKAAGVNRPDLLQRQGHYPPPEGASYIIGLEVAGIIEDTGEEVCALLEGGGYAQYVCARRSQCLPIPKGFSFEQAAALPECMFTVWNNVFVLGGFKDGERVLIHGGTSGIGSTAIQMIKAFGGEVIVTCGNDEKCQAALELGADRAINYKTYDFVEELDAPVHMVLDMVGGDYVRRNLECLAEHGRHVSIAFLNGAKSEIIIPTIMKKRLSLTGSILRSLPAEEKAKLANKILEKVWPKIENGQIKPLIHNVFSLQYVVEAHQELESGNTIGKIVLTV